MRPNIDTRQNAGRTRHAARWFALLALALTAAGCAILEERDYLRERTEMQEVKLQQMKDSLEQWQTAHDKLQTQLTERDQRITRLEAEQSVRERELERQLAAARTELDTARQESASLRADLDKTQTATQLQADLATREKTTLQSSVTALQTDLAAARAENDQLRKQLATAQARAKELEGSVAGLKKQLAGATESAGEAAKLRKELEKTRAAAKKSARPEAEPAGEGAGLNQARSDFAEALADLVRRKDAQVVGSADRVTVRLQSDFLFDPQTVVVTAEGREVLARVAQVLERYGDYQLLVEGHTDTTPVRNMPFPDNLALSAQRATNVLREIQDLTKLPQKQVRASGSASWIPVAPNTTAEGQRQNRRVEIILARP